MGTLREDKSRSQYLKTYLVAGGKEGKTTFLTASILGALPHQKEGGLVDKPQHLHVLAIDSNAVGGLGDFITKLCKRPESYLDVDVINLQDQARTTSLGSSDWDYSFFNAMVLSVKEVKEKIAKSPGVHAVVMSSLTGLAEALQRGLSGPPNPMKKGGGMDESKWQDLSRQLIEIRNLLQVDTHHVFWEGHVFRSGSKDQVHDEVGVPGKVGRNWGFNVDQVFRLRRELRVMYPNSQVEKQYVDTKPTLDFTSGGRGFTGVLADKEYDLVDVAKRLGYKVGGWKAES
jgi:hypothetical protein